MSQKKTAETAADRTQVTLRLPPTLREALGMAAFGNNRSINAEIIARLERSMGIDNELSELVDRLGRLEARVEENDLETDRRIDKLEAKVWDLETSVGGVDPNGWKD